MIIADRKHGNELLSVNIFSPVGWADDPDSMDGLAHLAEHLLLKGHGIADYRAFTSKYDSLGAALNSSTDADFMTIYMRLRKNHLAMALDDLNTLLDRFDVQNELILAERRRVSLEGSRAREDAIQLALRDIDGLRYRGTGYGRDPTSTRGLARATPRSLMDFYEHHLTGKWSLFVIGTTARQVPNVGWTVQPLQRDLSSMHNHLGLCYKLQRRARGVPIRGLSFHQDWSQDRLVEEALFGNYMAGGLSSILYRQVVYAAEETYSVRRHHTEHAFGYDLHFLWDAPRGKHVDLESLLDINKFHVTAREGLRIRERAITELLLLKENVGALARRSVRSLVYTGEILSIDNAISRLRSMPGRTVSRTIERIGTCPVIMLDQY